MIYPYIYVYLLIKFLLHVNVYTKCTISLIINIYDNIKMNIYKTKCIFIKRSIGIVVTFLKKNTIWFSKNKN